MIGPVFLGNGAEVWQSGGRAPDLLIICGSAIIRLREPQTAALRDFLNGQHAAAAAVDAEVIAAIAAPGAAIAAPGAADPVPVILCRCEAANCHVCALVKTGNQAPGCSCECHLATCDCSRHRLTRPQQQPHADGPEDPR